MPQRTMPNILIAGVGNYLLCDEGVGVHAARELLKVPPAHPLIAEVGTAILDALHLIEWADCILIIDAMEAGGRPGSIYTCTLGDLEVPPSHFSLHQLGIINALSFVRRDRPPKVFIIGIEPQIIGYGTALSETLQESLSKVLRIVFTKIDEWLAEEETLPEGSFGERFLPQERELV